MSTHNWLDVQVDRCLHTRPALRRLLRRKIVQVGEWSNSATIVTFLQFLSGFLDHYKLPDVEPIAEAYWSSKLRYGEDHVAVSGGGKGPLGVHIDGEADWYAWEMRQTMVAHAHVDPLDANLHQLELILRVAWHASVDEEIAQRARFQRDAESQAENAVIPVLPRTDHAMLSVPFL